MTRKSSQQWAAYAARRTGSCEPARRRKFGGERRTPTEFQVHISVARHFRLRAVPGVIWWHTPNGELRNKSVAAKSKAMGVLAGVPDLVLLHEGRAYGLELKTSTGRVSAEQRAVLAAFEQAGAFTAVAFNVEAALEILRAWGLLRGQSGEP